MRMLLPVMLVAAIGVTACEPKPKTAGEKVGEAVEDVGDSIQDAARPEPKTPAEKMGAAVEEAGDKVKDATN